MSSMLLDASKNGGILNYVLIAVVVILLISMPIMMNYRNKRDTQRIQEQTNSLKVGDKILTTSGIYGEIVKIKFDDSQKLVVIETGEDKKTQLCVDAYVIYTVFSDEEEVSEDGQETAKAEGKSKDETKKESEVKAETKVEKEDDVTKEVKVEGKTETVEEKPESASKSKKTKKETKNKKAD